MFSTAVECRQHRHGSIDGARRRSVTAWIRRQLHPAVHHRHRLAGGRRQHAHAQCHRHRQGIQVRAEHQLPRHHAWPSPARPPPTTASASSPRRRSTCSPCSRISRPRSRAARGGGSQRGIAAHSIGAAISNFDPALGSRGRRALRSGRAALGHRHRRGHARVEAVDLQACSRICATSTTPRPSAS